MSRPERSGRDSVYMCSNCKYIGNKKYMEVYFRKSFTKLHLLNDFTMIEVFIVKKQKLTSVYTKKDVYILKSLHKILGKNKVY